MWNHTIDESFDRFSDEYMADHAKVIHTFGSVAKVRLQAEANTPYTGLFRGADFGLIRLSLVKSPYDPCKGIPFTAGCFAPGIAVKFLRPNTYSNNLIAMTSLGSGQGQNFDFFLNPMKIWVPKPTGVAASIVMNVFSKAAEEPSHLGSLEFAAPNSDTKLTSSAVSAPTNVYFVPGPAVTKRFSSKPHDFRDDMGKIEEGTVLYELWAPGKDGCLCDGNPCLDPRKCDGAKKIGELITESVFVASSWGDRKLFFQHERFARKSRSKCAMAAAMADSDVYRMSGGFSTRCVANNLACSAGEKRD